MPNPGAFQGSCQDFLLGEKEAYALAVDGNYTSEALALIYQHYFKRYPISLQHHTEPSAEHLASVDDNVPDPEIEEPNVFSMPREEYELAMAQIRQCRREIDFRKGQIKRWMAYQYMKDHHVDPRETGAQNPYRTLMYRLTQRDVNRPRRKTPVNVWRKNKHTEIEQEMRVRHAAGGDIPKSRMATLRNKVARETFASLDDETRHQWEVLAAEEHNVALEQWQKELDAPPSTKPEDCQRSIQGLVSFVQPILDMICEVTGWKVSLIAGGPEPAQDSQLNVISIHSGTTSGDVKMTFGLAERANIKKYLIPMFGSFLQKCYSPEECRLHALPAEDGHLRVSQLDVENSAITIHTVRQKGDKNSTATSKSTNTVKSSQAPQSSGTSKRQGSEPSAMEHEEAPVSTPARTAVPMLETPPSGPNTSSNEACELPASTIAGPGATGSVTKHKAILAAESDTLNRVTSPPEEEGEMIRSRSPSPSRAVGAKTGFAQPEAPTQGVLSDLPVLENVTQPSSEGPDEIECVDAPDTRALQPVCDEIENDFPGNVNSVSRRPVQTVKKTSKVLLMEEMTILRGKKRKAEGLNDGRSTNNQSTAAKCGHVEKKRKGRGGE